MKARLRKDRPWILFFLVGGTLGLVLALCSSGFVTTFLIGASRRDEVFHVAWACGLGLGVGVVLRPDTLAGVLTQAACFLRVIEQFPDGGLQGLGIIRRDDQAAGAGLDQAEQPRDAGGDAGDCVRHRRRFGATGLPPDVRRDPSRERRDRAGSLVHAPRPRGVRAAGVRRASLAPRICNNAIDSRCWPSLFFAAQRENLCHACGRCGTGGVLRSSHGILHQCCHRRGACSVDIWSRRGCRCAKPERHSGASSAGHT